jgi:hypothetical protein
LKVGAVVEALKREVLLDQVMPNGKKRGDCTGAELVKFGGFDVKLGKKVGPKGTPNGKKITEAECWKIMR